MVNQQLLDYIKQQLEKNISKEQIKSALMQNGWDVSDVEEGFTVAGPRFSGIPSATPPPPTTPNVRPIPNMINPVITPIAQPASNVINPVATPNIQPAASSINPSAMPISYAGFWLRVSAALIDQIILANISLIFFLLLFFGFFSKNGQLMSNSEEIILYIFLTILVIIYFPFMESRGGATLGKKIFGIKVLKENGEPVKFFRSLVRNLFKYLISIGFVSAAFTEKNQALYDFFASCIVVRSRTVRVGKIWAIIILLMIMDFLLSLALMFFVLGIPFILMFFSPFKGDIPNPSNQNNIQFENNGDNVNPSPVATFTPLSVQEYDTYFSKPIAGLDNESDYRKAYTYVGPALIAFDIFGELNVVLPIIPNLENNRDYIWIDLTSVVSKTDKEILDRESIFEKNLLSKSLSLSKHLSKHSPPIEYLSGSRQIRLIDGFVSDVQKITGTLFFKIPLDSENSINFYEKSYPFVINM